MLSSATKLMFAVGFVIAMIAFYHLIHKKVDSDITLLGNNSKGGFDVLQVRNKIETSEEEIEKIKQGHKYIFSYSPRVSIRNMQVTHHFSIQKRMPVLPVYIGVGVAPSTLEVTGNISLIF